MAAESSVLVDQPMTVRCGSASMMRSPSGEIEKHALRKTHSRRGQSAGSSRAIKSSGSGS
eukprot:6144288-Prymnesium_polylepis.1